MLHPLERRRIATEATVAKYFGKPFAWGTHDCARMAAWHLRQFGVALGTDKAGTWRSAVGARRALTRLGAASLAELADANFERIPPAAALIGDIMIVPAEDAFGALWVSTGNGTALGWHEDAPGAAIIRASFIDTLAWRVF